MQYEDAIRMWGAQKLQERYPRGVFSADSVTVDMEFDPGFACCGGSNPDCYCSFAESPSADVVIKGKNTALKKPVSVETKISHYEFDFATILGEIVAAADGVVTEE